jgi:hypothetical protein
VKRAPHVKDQGKLFGGAALIVISALFFGAAWYLFLEGAPGAPEFSDNRPDYGNDSSVRLYLPAGSPAGSSTFDAHLRDDDGTTIQDVDITTSPRVGDWQEHQSYFGVVEFREGARMDDIQYYGGSSSQQGYQQPLSLMTGRSGSQFVTVRTGR